MSEIYRAHLLEAVRKNGLLLEFAPEQYKNDKEIVMAAMNNDVWALEHASSQLLSDREFFLEIVKIKGIAITFASSELKNDKELVLVAVQQKIGAIECASPELREIVDMEDPVASLESLIASEKLAQKLNQDLKQKPPKQERGMKI